MYLFNDNQKKKLTVTLTKVEGCKHNKSKEFNYMRGIHHIGVMLIHLNAAIVKMVYIFQTNSCTVFYRFKGFVM